jgi:hypothetical protein
MFIRMSTLGYSEVSNHYAIYPESIDVFFEKCYKVSKYLQNQMSVLPQYITESKSQLQAYEMRSLLFRVVEVINVHNPVKILELSVRLTVC